MRKVLTLQKKLTGVSEETGHYKVLKNILFVSRDNKQIEARVQTSFTYNINDRINDTEQKSVLFFL
jgi:hypothetical protein